jgi:hypothetical protein
MHNNNQLRLYYLGCTTNSDTIELHYSSTIYFDFFFFQINITHIRIEM